MNPYYDVTHRRRTIINWIIVVIILLYFGKCGWSIWLGNPKCIAEALGENRNQCGHLPWRFYQKDYLSVKADFEDMKHFVEEGFKRLGGTPYLIGISLIISRTERTNYCSFIYLFHKSSNWKCVEVTFNRASFELTVHVSVCKPPNISISSIVDKEWGNPFYVMEVVNPISDLLANRATADVVYDASNGDVFWRIREIGKEGVHYPLLHISKSSSVEPTDHGRQIVSPVEFYCIDSGDAVSPSRRNDTAVSGGFEEPADSDEGGETEEKR